MIVRPRLNSNAPQPAVPSSVAPPARQSLPLPSGNSAQRLSFSLLLLFLFIAYSRILDYFLSSLHLPLIIAILTLCFAIVSGGLLRTFSSKSGIFLTLFLVWMAICVPVSFWIGGSMQYLQEYVKSFLVFVLIVTSIRQSRNVLYAGYAIALAVVAVAALCFSIGVTDQFGRLTLVAGLLGNSNDLAQVLLVGIPFWILFANSPGSLSIRPLISAAVILVLLYLIMKTGSRAVMVGVFTVAGISFLSASLINKIKLAVAGTIGVTVLLLAMPGALRDRYATIFSNEQIGSEVGASAVASTSQRTELLKRSITMTLRHPVFGVGPGNFQPASAEAFGNQRGSAWFETHNTMTQVSSELGLPGLFLFCATLFFCFRSVLRLARWKPPAGQSVSPMAAAHVQTLNRIGGCLLLSLASLTLTAMFSSIAYHIFFPTLIGLCAALELTAGEELASLFPKAARGPLPRMSGALPARQMPGVRPAF